MSHFYIKSLKLSSWDDHYFNVHCKISRTLTFAPKIVQIFDTCYKNWVTFRPKAFIRTKINVTAFPKIKIGTFYFFIEFVQNPPIRNNLWENPGDMNFPFFIISFILTVRSDKESKNLIIIFNCKIHMNSELQSDNQTS